MTNPVIQLVKDLTMGVVGIVNVVFGVVIVLSPSLPFVRVLGGVLTIGGLVQILVGRN